MTAAASTTQHCFFQNEPLDRIVGWKHDLSSPLSLAYRVTRSSVLVLARTPSLTLRS